MPRFLSVIVTLLVLTTAGIVVATRLQEVQLLPASITELFSRNTANLAETIATLLEREIITPAPLRGSFDRPAGALTVEGILRETNKHRAVEKVPPVGTNNILNRAAENKVADMIARQYFDHVAPDGIGPADVVEGVGYEYLRVGENLALGNFASDAELIEAWMNSPGHRANILSPGFTELGAAARQGKFEGKNTWFAVQTFALPASVCTLPNTALRTRFEQKKAEAEQLNNTLATEQEKHTQGAAELQSLASEITRLREQGNARTEEGNRKIEEGNTIYRETGSREQAQPYWDEGERLQQEGRALTEEAATKQTVFQEKKNNLRTAQQSYNQKVDRFNALNEELKQYTQDLNTQIQRYNKCLGSYQK